MSSIRKLGVGMVGLGGITNAHRKGYHDWDIPLVAGYDLNPGARKAFAENEPQATVHDSLEALLDNPNVEVIDLATPHWYDARIPPIQRIAAAGKPVFIQKPLAMTYQDAEEIAELLARHNVIGMTNQNMCFTPGGLALSRMVLDEQAIGKPGYAEMLMRLRFDLPEDHWFGKDPRWMIIGCAVHQISLMHQVLGPPETVYAATGVDPAQPGVTHDGFGHAIFRYPGGQVATLLSTGDYYGGCPVGWGSERSYFQGDGGLIDFEAESKLEWHRRAGKSHDSEITHQTVPMTGSWFGDAFAVGMLHFQWALQTQRTPLCHVDDNLYVMAVCEAAYRSSESNQVVRIGDIMGDRYDPDYGPGWRHGSAGWTNPYPSAKVSS